MDKCTIWRGFSILINTPPQTLTTTSSIFFHFFPFYNRGKLKFSCPHCKQGKTARFAKQKQMKKIDKMKNHTAPKFKQLIVLTIALLSLPGIGNCQETKNNPEKKAFQFTMVPPISSAGYHAKDYSYSGSLNMLYGITGGIEGIEISAFGSHTRNDVSGFQLAGFGHTVAGNVKGAQISGFGNYVHQDIAGFQLAGFTNIVNEMKSGAQIAGFANISKGSANGAQIAGFSNISHGTVNTQIGGFMNKTKILKGVQLGIINLTDSVASGTPIGFLSIVKKGYRAFEVSTNETFHGVASFKIGVSQFYNIFSLGAHINQDDLFWGWGVGFGTTFNYSTKWQSQLEATSFQINEDEWFTDEFNQHNKLQFTLAYKSTENIRFFVGASWNVNVRDLENRDAMKIAPWKPFDEKVNETHVEMYPGFTAGIRF